MKYVMLLVTQLPLHGVMLFMSQWCVKLLGLPLMVLSLVHDLCVWGIWIPQSESEVLFNIRVVDTDAQSCELLIIIVVAVVVVNHFIIIVDAETKPEEALTAATFFIDATVPNTYV